MVGQPVLSGGADTIGFDGFFNSGSAPAVIDRLVIVSPRHIKLIGAYVTLGGPVGNWVTFPPSFPTSASGRRENSYFIRRWARHLIPAGAVIPPHQWAGIALASTPQPRRAASQRPTCITTSAAPITNGAGTSG